MKIWYRFIPQEGLDHLKQYKYSCTDKSIMTNYVMQPIWGKMINLMPSVLAYTPRFSPGLLVSSSKRLLPSRLLVLVLALHFAVSRP